MEFESVDAATAIDILLLLLIGIGPKIALVPFLDVTAGMDEATKRRVVRKMLATAALAAVVLLLLGGLLTRLLHFSAGALGVSSGIILLIIAITMVLGGSGEQQAGKLSDQDPMRLAVFPLAVPYLLNPAGIVVLVTASAEAGTLGVYGIVLGALAVVIVLDAVVFRWAAQVGGRLNASSMLVTEKVFGFLLAALAVQLALDGLADLGVIHLMHH